VLPSDEIQIIKAGTEKGVVWVGTPEGAARIENGVCTLLKPTKGLKVWDIARCAEGGYWIGHDQGILLVDGERTVKALSGLNVGSIQQFGKGFWCIAKDESKDRNTLMEAKGESWVPVAAFQNRKVLDLERDSKGTFWVRLDGDGVLEIDPEKPLAEAKHHLARMQITSVMSDSKGTIWCGLMSEGIMVRTGVEWKRVLDREKTAVMTLLEDSTGLIWAATSGNGAWTYDGKSWTGRLQKEGPVNLLKMTADKRLWISTAQTGGLRYWDGKEWKPSLETPMPVNQLVESGPGTLLAGTILDGLYVLGNLSIKGE
jgi:ligand-binding sensor domain-containing protein